MRNVLKFSLVVLFVGGLMIATADHAEARPQYLKAFTTAYPGVKAATKVKCGVCQPEKSKKVRNGYGKAFGGGLTKKNEKDKAALKAALTKGEAGKGEGGKTFGEQIKAGELPK